MPTPLGQIFHLYNRLGFGITYKEAKLLSEKPLNDIVKGVVLTSVIGGYITEISKEEAATYKRVNDGNQDRDQMQKQISQRLRDLNIAWMKRLLNTEHVLLEKQTLFWHNHFACRVRHPYLMQELNNTHRKLAFSNFRELLVEVCKSPAMLLYLNNQQNKKEHPNENFARELMELFTLGRGNYTEQDVQEAARAFTGWAFNKDNGEFEFREKVHDFGEKTIFNRKGNWGGEDVINMIMSNKQTAYFLCRKMYKYYINENVNESHVKELAEFYYMNQYNTAALLKKMFSSPYFFAVENIGSNIKSPVEFLIGLSRQFNVKYTKPEILLKLQQALGQTLFFPPNVAGWPGGRNFIDSTTLLLRMKIPSMLLNNGAIEVEEREDDPDAMHRKDHSEITKFGTEVNWNEVILSTVKLEPEVLQKVYLSRLPRKPITDLIATEAALERKEMILKIVSLPEYSLT